MRPFYVILFVLMAVMAKAEVPMDLDSPFSKTVVFSNALGQKEMREVVGVEKKGSLVELRKADGTFFVLPEDKLVAIVPKLPNAGQKYTREDASKAYLFLQKTQPQLSGMEEVSPAALKAWANMAYQESSYELEAKKAKAAMIQNWFSKVSLEDDQDKSVSLEQYVREGEALLGQSGDAKEAIEKRLERARQRMAMDFSKIEKTHLVPEWANVSPTLPLAVISLLALLSFWGFLNISNFLTATKVAVMSLLSSERSSRALVVNFRSILGIILGPLLFYVVYLATKTEKIAPTSKNENLSQACKRALYLSLNSQFKWSSQASQKTEVSATEILGYIFSKIENPESEGATFVVYGAPIFHVSPEQISWTQGMKLLWIPIQLTFSLPVGDGLFSFENPKISGCSIGKLSLGAFLGKYVVEELIPAFIEFDQKIGLNSKAEWRWKDKATILVVTPDVLPKKANNTIAEGASVKKPKFKQQISASELAAIFLGGDGDAYMGRYVDVKGRIVEVSSEHRLGNNSATEVLRKSLNSSGGVVVNRSSPMGAEDAPDIFYLSTEDSPEASKIKVKCVVKASEAFYLDSHGDLYREGQKPETNDPLVRKGVEALFKGGRVESFERGVIELYDAKISTSENKSEPKKEIKENEN